ncbi:hypothetical protein [Lacrimispora defluvii]|uniref:DUF3592 domain-containing protein n=1 Tax=Lacrimispora defluvii TaxID=2719233 RepID=A0ABX1W015_9FIRM|nr:hypothetical protein [Lacrimispora defluvii]NNJ33379.1 hypothetical protein [Lacrimispora defluvii]NNJ33416.1 hypothetical protein [Lacrimispora defluvii]
MIIMLIFYTCLICYIIYLTIKAAIMSIKIRKYKGRTIGEIINVSEYVTYNKLYKKILYYPTYRYIVGGITYEEDFPFCKKSQKLIQIGQEKMIIFDKKKPKNFVPEGEEYVWFKQAFIGLSCILFWFLIAIYAYYKDYK